MSIPTIPSKTIPISIDVTEDDDEDDWSIDSLCFGETVYTWSSA